MGAASVFSIDDDGPNAQTATPGTAAAIALDETIPDDSDTADFSVHFVTAGVDYGTDGAGDVKYSWSLTGANVASGLYALDASDVEDIIDGIGQGNEIVLNVSGLVITGSDGGTDYFTLTLNEDTGVVTFAQENNIWHSDTADDDETATLTLGAGVLELDQTVTDADGDTDVASYDVGAASVFSIDDDGPSAIDPDSAAIMNIVDESVTGVALDIDSNIDDNVGTDQTGTLMFDNVSPTGTLTDESSGDLDIYIYTDGTTLIGSTLVGSDYAAVSADTATQVYTVALNLDGALASSADTYNFTLHQLLDGGLTTFNVTDAGFNFNGGNDPYSYFDDTLPNDLNGDQDVLLTPMVGGVSAGTTNTSNISGGIGAGNSVDSGEAIRVDYVHGLSGDPTKNISDADYSNLINQDHVFDGHNTVNGASAVFTGITGGMGSPTSDILIEAYDDNDGDDVVGDGFLDTITAIQITYDGDTVKALRGIGIVVVEVGGVTYTLDWTDSMKVTVGGVVSDTEIASFTATGLTSIEYHHDGGQSFKVGGFGAAIPTPGDPIDLDFDLKLADADGDTAAGQLNITVTPEPIELPELPTVPYLSGIASYESGGSAGGGHPETDAGDLVELMLDDTEMFLPSEDSVGKEGQDIDAIHMLSRGDDTPPNDDSTYIFAASSAFNGDTEVKTDGAANLYKYDNGTITQYAPTFDGNSPITEFGNVNVTGLFILPNDEGVILAFGQGSDDFGKSELVFWDGIDAEIIFNLDDFASGGQTEIGIQALDVLELTTDASGGGLNITGTNYYIESMAFSTIADWSDGSTNYSGELDLIAATFTSGTPSFEILANSAADEIDALSGSKLALDVSDLLPDDLTDGGIDAYLQLIDTDTGIDVYVDVDGDLNGSNFTAQAMATGDYNVDDIVIVANNGPTDLFEVTVQADVS